MIYTLTLNPALDREMTVPEIALDRVLRATSIRTDLGGKGFNVSRALLALGCESVALGFAGGAISRQLEQGLNDMGIRTDFVPVGGETRINISVVSSDHSHYLKVNEAGPEVSDTAVKAMLDKIKLKAKPGDWWVMAGSLPPGLLGDFVPAVIQLIQAAGANAALDMEGLPLKLGCQAHVRLVKPNALEASGLVGHPLTDLSQVIAAVYEIHALGAQQIAISMGKAGAVYSDGSRLWQATPPVIDEHNPIGAGDAMLAGLIYGLTNGLDGGQVLRWGVSCGAAAAGLPGTAMATLQQVQQLVSKVRVEELDKSIGS